MTEDVADLPKILGFNLLYHFSSTGHLVVCTLGIFVFYILYGYTQEWIFSNPGFRPFGWYLTLVQFFLYSIFASIEQAITKLRSKDESNTTTTSENVLLPTSNMPASPRKPPYKIYALVAFLTVTTIGCSNTSLAFLNYPTQVIFKCCKLIPVMLGGILIQNKKYGPLDFFAAFLMTIGLIFFTLADVSVSPKFDIRGVALILLALAADAAIGNVQEKTMKALKASNVEIIFYSYLMGSAYLITGLVLTNQFLEPFKFTMNDPSIYGSIFIFSFSGYIGLQFVLALVRIFGAFIAVTVTTGRKALSIVVSFMFFTKPFTMQYVWSGLIVVFGIFLNVYSKNRSKKNRQNQGSSGYFCLGELNACLSWVLNISTGAARRASVTATSRIKYQEIRTQNI